MLMIRRMLYDAAYTLPSVLQMGYNISVMQVYKVGMEKYV